MVKKMVAVKQRLILISILVLAFTVYSGSCAAAGIRDMQPDAACGFLEAVGLSTRSWKNDEDHSWGCSSPSKQFGKGDPFKNDLSYYVEGTGDSVSQLKLVLNVKNINEAADAQDLLSSVFHLLFEKVANQAIPDHMAEAIAKGDNYSLIADDMAVTITRTNWSMTMDWGVFKGYDIKVIIK